MFFRRLGQLGREKGVASDNSGWKEEPRMRGTAREDGYKLLRLVRGLPRGRAQGASTNHVLHLTG